MSEFAFQQALVRLLTDSTLRESFFAGDQQTMMQSGFSTEELDRLVGIDAERLALFAEMVLGQRISDATEGLPMTARIMGDHFAHLGMQFCNRTKLDFGTRRDSPLAFARFLKRQFELKPPTTPFLEDVLHYETISLELLIEAEEHPLTEADRGIPSSKAGGYLLTEVPFRLAHSRVVCFAFDVPSIIKQLKAKQVPLAPEPEATHLIVQVGSSGTIQQSKVNRHTLSFLQACDGTTSLGSIIGRLFDELQQDASQLQKFTDQCVSLCMALVERWIIGFKRHPPHSDVN